MSRENLCKHTTRVAIRYPEGITLHQDGIVNDIDELLAGRGPVYRFSLSKFEAFFGSYGETLEEATSDSDTQVEQLLGHLGLWAETIEEYLVNPNELQTEEQVIDYVRQLKQDPNYQGADIVPFRRS